MDNKNDYLRANFRRRARYEAVFVILIAAALLIVVLNINIGSVPIPVSEIARIIFTRTGDRQNRHQVQIQQFIFHVMISKGAVSRF